MLYLEDFLELIENLPSELRDRFTEIRTLDLEVQNGLDVAEKCVEEFFNVANDSTIEDQKRAYDKIKDDYRRILENADEKVGLATMMHDLVKRHLAKLDQEVNKFKIELEADSPGITEALEKKVKDAEQITRMPRKERSKKRKKTLLNGDLSHEAADALFAGPFNGGTGHFDFHSPRHASIVQNGQSAVTLSTGANFKKSSSVPNRLAETNKVQLAVCQQQQAVAREKPSGAALAGQIAGPSGAGFLHSFTENTESRHGRPRKLTSRVSEMLRDVIQKQEQRERAGSTDGAALLGTCLAGAASSSTQPHFSHGQYPAGGLHHHAYNQHNQQHHLRQNYHGQMDSDVDVANEAAELSDQSDQQRWCICNRVSFGAMVACDDKDCPFEWFHYECVGINQPPKGKWFCPHCTKRRK